MDKMVDEIFSNYGIADDIVGETLDIIRKHGYIHRSEAVECCEIEIETSDPNDVDKINSISGDITIKLKEEQGGENGND